jgi:hypothetical protein
MKGLIKEKYYSYTKNYLDDTYGPKTDHDGKIQAADESL